MTRQLCIWICGVDKSEEGADWCVQGAADASPSFTKRPARLCSSKCRSACEGRISTSCPERGNTVQVSQASRPPMRVAAGLRTEAGLGGSPQWSAPCPPPAAPTLIAVGCPAPASGSVDVLMLRVQRCYGKPPVHHVPHCVSGMLVMTVYICSGGHALAIFMRGVWRASLA